MHIALLVSAALAGGEGWAQQVDALLAPWTRDDAPGGAVAVLERGQPAWTRAFGMADLAAGRPMTPQTPCYLASLAKPFTAACAVLAARDGALDLDASLLELFPELPQGHGAATLRQCLHHRSGVPDLYDATIGADLDPGVLASNAAAIGLLRRLPALSFPPGSEFLYSNSG